MTDWKRKKLWLEHETGRNRPYGLEGEVTTSFARDSQFKPYCGHWNLWSKLISSTTITVSQFETWLEDEVSQHRSTTPVIR